MINTECIAKLLPMTILASPVDYSCFCQLLKTQHNCMHNREYNLPSPDHPLPPSTHTLIQNLLDYSSCKKVAQNPAVLAT